MMIMRPKGSAMMVIFSLMLIIVSITIVIALSPLRASAPTATHTFTYTIDRSAVPDLYYNEITLEIATGGGQVVSVMADGNAQSYTLSDSGDMLRITTDANQLDVTISDPADGDALGTYRMTPLKDDKAFAFSIGFDDNVALQPAIDLLNEKGLAGTLFLITGLIEDLQPTVDPIITNQDIHDLVSMGWGIGNHTTSEDCLIPTDDQGITQADDELRDIIAQSPVPSYKLISFAAPCFISEYHPLILNLRDNGPSRDLQFNESGNRSIMQVDPDATEVAFTINNDYTILFDFDEPVGRDFDLETVAARVDLIVEEYRNSGAHFWYNTLQHGREPDTQQTAEQIRPMIEHVYDNYGPGGSEDIVWFAPSDQIYSYLLVRDNVQISQVASGDPTPTSAFTATPPPSATPTPTLAATPTDIPTATPAGPVIDPTPDVGLSYAYYEEFLFPAAVPRDWEQYTPVRVGEAADFTLPAPVRDNFFQVRYMGCIQIPFSGEYTFYTNSDDGTLLYIDEELIVDNDGAHLVEEQSGTINLVAGTYSIELGYLQQDFLAELQVLYEGPQITKQRIPAGILGCDREIDLPTPAPTVDATAAVTPTMATGATATAESTVMPTGMPTGGPTAELTATPAATPIVMPDEGLAYAYYEEFLFPSIVPSDWEQYTSIRVGEATDFTLPTQTRDDYFQVRYMGCIQIPFSGEYTFYTSSDDGTLLYIDDELIVDNDGAHLVEEQSGIINLTEGAYSIEVGYFQQDFMADLQILYEGPQIAKQEVPAGILGCNREIVLPTPAPTAIDTPTPMSTTMPTAMPTTMLTPMPTTMATVVPNATDTANTNSSDSSIWLPFAVK